MEIQEKLTLRAKQSLQNKAEITEQIAEIALKEARELTKNLPLPEPTLLDIAMFRLKLLLKIEPNELDLILYKEALKIAGSFSVDENGEILSNTKYGMRKSEF